MRKVKTTQKIQYLAPEVEAKVIPSPTDGWDQISPLAEMDPKRAPILTNWVPRPGYVEARQGYYVWNNIGTAPVETIMVYRPANGGQTMFAASGSSIFNVSNYAVQNQVVTGLGSARWQWTNFTTSATPPVVSVLQCVNGVDPLYQWNGTAWSTPVITGLSFGDTTANFINIFAQKQRLWYIVANSTRVYFLGTDAIQGAVAGFQDLGTLFSRGGSLLAMADWTIDGGNGPQDYVAFISTQGQIALYAGTDPTNASAWSLVGVFTIAPPIGYRCAWQIGSDVGIITQQGVLPISQVLPFDPSADRSVAITARIQNAMAQAAQNGADLFGWQLMTYPMQQLLVLNIPLEENAAQQQFVMNTLTGAWCEFTGWNANCFEVFNNQLYFGDNSGNVGLAYSGLTDAGAGVVLDMQCAFNWFDEPGKEKRMTMIQPLLTTQGTVSPALAVDTDFFTSSVVNTINITGAGAVWDTAIWDQSLWSTGTTNYTSWLSVEAIGHAFAARMHFTLPSSGTEGSLPVFDVAMFDDSTFDKGFNGEAIVLQVNAFNALLETGGAV
jgi:hypothetical protein